jgi:hypothetical protein
MTKTISKCNSCKKTCENDFIICPWCKGDIVSVGDCRECGAKQVNGKTFGCGHFFCQPCYDTSKGTKSCQISRCSPRYYKCQYGDEVFGRYCSFTPKQAANKAFTQIVQRERRNNNIITSARFTLIECTKNRLKKYKSSYEGIRLKLDKPKIVHIKSSYGNKIVQYTHVNKITPTSLIEA